MLMDRQFGQDEKIIAVPTHALTKRYDNVKDYSDMPEITLKQIEHFFEHYKDLEPGKWVKIGGWQNVDVAEAADHRGCRPRQRRQGLSLPPLQNVAFR